MEKRKIGSITKMSEGKYRIRISCGFDDFGKRQVVQKVVKAKSDLEAEKIMIELYTNREKEMSIKHGAPETLQELYDEWTKNHVSKLAENTQSFYADLWKNISKKGNIKLKNISAGNLNEIINCVSEEHERTRSGIYKMLKAMFNKAIKWRYMPENPCNYIDAPKYKAKEKNILTKDMASVVLENLSNEEIKYQAMFFLACTCSLRRQEVIALRWSDIDFTNRSIQIANAAAYVKGKGTTIKETKTERSARKLHMSDTLYYLFLRMQNQQMKEKQMLGNLYHDEGFIFTQWNGKCMNVTTPSHWWRKFSKRIGVTGITFHDLRHTAASMMIVNHVPISTVSAVLGHANITTTLNTYTHVIEDTKKDAIQVLDNIFNFDKPASNEKTAKNQSVS